MARPTTCLLVPLLLLPACGARSDAASGTGVRIVASFYPLAFVAEEVGGAHTDVENLTPPGAEPHDLELTAGQIRALAEADLVLYLGGGFQPSVEDAVAGVDGEVIDVLDTQDNLREASPDDKEEDEEAHGAESELDPHVWLDPQRVAAMAGVVEARLAEIDPKHAAAYRSNAARLTERLNALDAAYRVGLRTCRQDAIVSSHESFGYLADAYGLGQIGIAGIDPETEPSPRRLGEVAEFVRRYRVTTIFFETLVSPDVAETLADEVGIDTARLDPLEGPPDNGDYFTAMRANLKTLREGLACT